MYLHEYLSFSLCGICQTVSVFNVLKQRKKHYVNDASNHDASFPALPFHVAQSLTFCVVFCEPFCIFAVCVVCLYSIYGL
jgi:hypothetical protein